MMFHVASMVVLLAEQVKQTQCLVQCAPNSSQDPLWGRLLLSAIPSIFALGIAWLAFRWSSTQENIHWLRDQKKAEWQEIHRLIFEVWNILQPVIRKEELDLVTHGSLFDAVRRLRQPLSRTLFVTCPFDDAHFRHQFDEFLFKVDQKGNEVKGMVDDLRTVEPVHGITYTPQERADKMNKTIEARGNLIQELTNCFQKIDSKLRALMVRDLDL